MPKSSAGILLYQKIDQEIMILLGHMGGPFWSSKDNHAWTIPKGEFDPEEENPVAAAKREFKEETGIEISETLFALQPFSKNNKHFYFYLCAKDADPDILKSNSFEMEWPPKSGKIQLFPELDRFGWFGLVDAKKKLVKGQLPVLDQIGDWGFDSAQPDTRGEEVIGPEPGR